MITVGNENKDVKSQRHKNAWAETTNKRLAGLFSKKTQSWQLRYEGFLLHPGGMLTAKSLQWCPTVCNPMDCSLPGSSVHGIFQARVLEWGAIAFSRGDSYLTSNLHAGHGSQIFMFQIPGSLLEHELGSIEQTKLRVVGRGKRWKNMLEIAESRDVNEK